MRSWTVRKIRRRKLFTGSCLLRWSEISSENRWSREPGLADDGHQLNLTLCKSSQYNSHYDKAYFYHLQSYIEEFESVTIFYGYILGFSELVADCSPTEVMVEARGPLIS